MPLSELVYKMFNPQPDSSKDENPSSSNDPSFVPENDFVELVWENGQIQSSRARKVQSIHTLTSQNPKIRDKDFGNHSGVKMGKFGTAEPVLNEIPMPVPSVEMGLNQDDDMVPWLNYSINESPQHDYCSEFLPELSGVTVNEHSSQNNFSSFGKSSADRLSRDSHTVSLHSGLSLDQGSVLKTSLGDNTRPRTSAAQLFPSPSQQYQSSIPDFRSRISINNGDSTRNQTSIAEMVNPTAGSCFPNLKMQKHTSVSPATNSSFMNFSHFSRPAALVKASIQNIGAKAGVGTPDITRIGAKAGVGTPDITRMGTKNKTSIASTANPSEVTRNVTSAELRNEPSSHCHPHMVLSKLDATSLDAKSVNRATPPEISVSANREDDSRNDKNYSQNFGESMNKGFTDGEKTIEPGVASSSVCSGNSVERASDDPTQNLKRKNGDTEESEGPSEDVEEESVGIKKTAPARAGNGSKRSRAAEVHNLSERRRRDRINEKMRALQELIPNCNKVDKASMLDEAIEYLKTLQLQVQIMSMGTGMYMPPMMLPPGMPHMPHMAQFSPMGVGMGIGMGMGMGFGMGMPDMNAGSSGSMMQMPPMHGAHFPGPQMPGPGAFHGMGASNFQMFGLPGQGLPMGYPPRAPLMPMSQGPLLKTNAVNNPDSAHVSGPKDSIQNINLQTEQHGGATNSLNQNDQVTDKCFEQPSLAQCCGQTSEVTDNGGMQLTNGSANKTARGNGCD